MNGLRKRIQRALPPSWEEVLRKNKCLEKYVEYVYRSLPNYMKGSNKRVGYKKRNYVYGILNVESYFQNRKLSDCFQGQYKNIDGIDWKKLEEQIKNLEDSWR